MQPLSKQEKKIAKLLAQGNTKKEVAYFLNISVNTVDTHTKTIYSKTNCRNLADITRFIIQKITGIDTNQVLNSWQTEIPGQLALFILILLIVMAFLLQLINQDTFLFGSDIRIVTRIFG